MSAPVSTPIARFDGPAAWAALPEAARAEIGALALELVCVWHLIDAEGTGPESALPPVLARAALAADRLINPALEDRVHQVLPEGAFRAADGVTPRLPSLLGGVCRSCGWSQADAEAVGYGSTAVAEGSGWAARDLCTECADRDRPASCECGQRPDFDEEEGIWRGPFCQACA